MEANILLNSRANVPFVCLVFFFRKSLIFELFINLNATEFMQICKDYNMLGLQYVRSKGHVNDEECERMSSLLT